MHDDGLENVTPLDNEVNSHFCDVWKRLEHFSEKVVLEGRDIKP